MRPAAQPAAPSATGGSAAPALEWSAAQAFRTPQFITRALAHFCCCAAHSGPIFHRVSYAMVCGIAPLTAVTVYSLAGFSGLGGRLALGVMAMLGASLENVIVALSLVYMPRVARVARAPVLAERKLEYVEAARSGGASPARILFRHLLPNVTSPIIVQATVVFAYAMVVVGAMQGAGDTKSPLWISIISLWGLRVPMAYVLAFVLHMGSHGAWLAMSITQGVQGVLCLIVFRQGHWKYKRV